MRHPSGPVRNQGEESFVVKVGSLVVCHLGVAHTSLIFRKCMGQPPTICIQSRRAKYILLYCQGQTNAPCFHYGSHYILCQRQAIARQSISSILPSGALSSVAEGRRIAHTKTVLLRSECRWSSTGLSAVNGREIMLILSRH